MNVAQKNIVIFGGGPAGLAAALALRGKNYNVSVVEQNTYQKSRMVEHFPSRAIPCLSQLGIKLSIGTFQPCYNIASCWGGEDVVSNSFNSEMFGYGYLLHRPEFDISMLETAESHGIQIIKNTKLLRLKYDDTWQVDLNTQQGPQTLQADFIVDATGRHSGLVNLLGQQLSRLDELVGIVGILQFNKKSSQQYNGHVLLEADEHGWWHSLYLRDGLIAVTYITDLNSLITSKHTAKALWKRKLSSSIHTNLRTTDAVFDTNSCNVYSASTQYLRRSFGDTWLAIGDAAIAYDPLTSVGISNGLMDGIKAANTLESFFNGDNEALQAHARKRQDQFLGYLRQRRSYYAIETRWRRSAFWRQCHEEKLSPTLVM